MTSLCLDYGMLCDIITLLLTLSSRKEVTALHTIFDLIVSIIASVIAYYICKWLDGDE